MVPENEDSVAIERRGGTLANPSGNRHVAKVALPQERAVHVVAVQTTRPEEGADNLAVGHGGGRGPTLELSFVGLLGRRRPFPDDAPIVPVEREDDEPVHVVRAGRLAGASRDRGQDEHVVAPHDG